MELVKELKKTESPKIDPNVDKNQYAIKIESQSVGKRCWDN